MGNISIDKGNVNTIARVERLELTLLKVQKMRVGLPSASIPAPEIGFAAILSPDFSLRIRS